MVGVIRTISTKSILLAFVVIFAGEWLLYNIGVCFEELVEKIFHSSKLIWKCRELSACVKGMLRNPDQSSEILIKFHRFLKHKSHPECEILFHWIFGHSR